MVGFFAHDADAFGIDACVFVADLAVDAARGTADGIHACLIVDADLGCFAVGIAAFCLVDTDVVDACLVIVAVGIAAFWLVLASAIDAHLFCRANGIAAFIEACIVLADLVARTCGACVARREIAWDVVVTADES